MGKKSSKTPMLYVIGMLVIVIGFFCPMFKTGLGSGSNGFKFITGDNFGFVNIGALLILVGAILGLVISFVKLPKIDIPTIVPIIVSIAGGLILVIGFNDNAIYKFIGKQFLKYAYIGFYSILIGWVVSIVGFVTKK